MTSTSSDSESFSAISSESSQESLNQIAPRNNVKEHLLIKLPKESMQSSSTNSSSISSQCTESSNSDDGCTEPLVVCNQSIESSSSISSGSGCIEPLIACNQSIGSSSSISSGSGCTEPLIACNQSIGSSSSSISSQCTESSNSSSRCNEPLIPCNQCTESASSSIGSSDSCSSPTETLELSSNGRRGMIESIKEHKVLISLFALALIIVSILCGKQFTNYLVDDDDDSRSPLVMLENLCHGAKYRGFMECHHGICGDLSVGESIASSDCRLIWRLEKGGYVSLWDTMPPQQRARSVMDDVEWKLMERQRICDHGIGSNDMLILGDTKMWIQRKHDDATHHFCESSWNGKASSLMVDSNGIVVAEYAFCRKATSQGKVPCHDGRCDELQNGGSLVSEDCQFLLETYRNGTLVLRKMVNEDRNDVIWTEDLETLLKRLRFRGSDIAEFGLDDSGSVSFIDQWGSTYSVPAEIHGAKYRGDLDCDSADDGICGELLPGESWTSQNGDYVLRYEERGIALWDTKPSNEWILIWFVEFDDVENGEAVTLQTIGVAFTTDRYTSRSVKLWNGNAGSLSLENGDVNVAEYRFCRNALFQREIECPDDLECDLSNLIPDSVILVDDNCDHWLTLDDGGDLYLNREENDDGDSQILLGNLESMIEESEFGDSQIAQFLREIFEKMIDEISKTQQPSTEQTLDPSPEPTQSPSGKPSEMTENPSQSPTPKPSENETETPTQNTSKNPSLPPSSSPILPPTSNPTLPPSSIPTLSSSSIPTLPPSSSPILPPSSNPTLPPSSITFIPTLPPSSNPTSPPSSNPSMSSSKSPSLPPSVSPTLPPSLNPTSPPSSNPSLPPSLSLTLPPTSNPTLPPTSNPTLPPTSNPTLPPTSNPTLPPTSNPTLPPTSNPTLPPTSNPTLPPTSNPSLPPSLSPSLSPTLTPRATLTCQDSGEVFTEIDYLAPLPFDQECVIIQQDGSKMLDMSPGGLLQFQSPVDVCLVYGGVMLTAAGDVDKFNVRSMVSFSCVSVNQASTSANPDPGTDLGRAQCVSDDDRYRFKVNAHSDHLEILDMWNNYWTFTDPNVKLFPSLNHGFKLFCKPKDHANECCSCLYPTPGFAGCSASSNCQTAVCDVSSFGDCCAGVPGWDQHCVDCGATEKCSIASTAVMC